MSTRQNGAIALCIPACNAAKILPRILRSDQAQSRAFHEILVYDDCSTDDTRSVAEAFGARLIRGDRNVGCSIGKKRLAEAATSAWIHFHDADDGLLPKFISRADSWTALGSAPDVVLVASLDAEVS